MGRKKKPKFKEGDVFVSKEMTPIERIAGICYRIKHIFEEDDGFYCDLEVLATNPQALRVTVSFFTEMLSDIFELNFRIARGENLITFSDCVKTVEFIDVIYVSDYVLERDFVKLPKNAVKKRKVNIGKILRDKAIKLFNIGGDKK